MHFALGRGGTGPARGLTEHILLAVLPAIKMPGMDGLQLLGEIRQRSPDLPVMIITGYGDDERYRRVSELDAAKIPRRAVDFDLLSERLPAVYCHGREQYSSTE
jgi:two-component system, response regulator, stage 0 sporulation protein F